jgi:hypothetical protein
MEIYQRTGSARLHLAVFSCLFLLNLIIVWRLLGSEYLIHYGSIEPIFYALARYLGKHWRHPGWWREWMGGMPFSCTYQPLFHYLNAFVASKTHWSPARAFHFDLGVSYALGPSMLYLLAFRLTKRIGPALLAALIYSLWSPSALLIPDIVRDMGTAYGARRLHAAVVYGDGPQVFGLTLVPLVLVAINRFLERPSILSWFVGSLCLIAVPLTNIPASMSLAMALVAFILAADIREWPWRGLVVGGGAITGFALTAIWMPRSALAVTFHNSQWMDPQGRLADKVLLAAFMVMAAAALTKISVSLYMRFCILFALLTSIVVLGKVYFGITFIGQATRFHLVLEMAVALLLGGIVAAILQTPVKWIRLTIAAALLVVAGVQFVNYQAFAQHTILRGPITGRSEYKVARWFAENAAGARVYVPGSMAYWLNTFTDTAQLTGCCDQNELFSAPRIANYVVGSDDHAGDRAVEISRAWLITLGVRYIAVPGPDSDEVYKAIHRPHKFDGILAERWRKDGNTIFEVNANLSSLAHWVYPSELVLTKPVSGLDVAPLEKYVAAVADPLRPPAVLRWLNSSAAVVEGTKQPLEVLSLQIPYHFGWRASSLRDGSQAEALTVEKDALGMIVVTPNCDACVVYFTFDGGKEAIVLRTVTIVSWAVVLLLVVAYWTRWKPGWMGAVASK